MSRFEDVSNMAFVGRILSFLNISKQLLAVKNLLGRDMTRPYFSVRFYDKRRCSKFVLKEVQTAINSQRNCKYLLYL